MNSEGRSRVLLTLYDSQVQGSCFVIDSQDAKIKGKNAVDVTVSNRNSDSAAAHAGDVTVQLLDAASNELVASTKSTGGLAGGASTSLAFSVSQSNLASQFNSVFLVVEQRS